MQDLVGGQIDLMCDLAANSLSLVRSGQIKAYAVMSKNRWFAAPETPTVDELGMPGLYLSYWQGLWAPKGTSTDVINKINSAVIDALAEPAVRRRLSDLGQEVPPPERQRPYELAAYHKAETEKWFPIIRAANIKPDWPLLPLSNVP